MAQAAAASDVGRARGRDDALRHRRRARRRLLRRAARALRRLGAAAARAPPGAAPARGEQRRRCCATRPATTTSCAPAWRSTAWTRSRRTPAARDLEPALELVSYVAAIKPCARGRERGLRPALRGRGGHGDRHRADRLRRRRQPRADQQRRAAGRRPALPAGRHRVDGQRHRRPRRRRRPACRSATRPCSSAAGLPAEEMARRLGTINYEITCSLTARVPREHHRDGVRAVIEMLREALAGERAWLVGGALRDRLLGRPTPDLDVVVDGDVAPRGAQPRPRRRRRLVRALRPVRRLARGRARPQLAGRHHAAAGRVPGGRPRRARPDGQRDGRAAGRRRARRSARRRERPRPQAPADGQRRGVRRRSAAHAARRAPGHRAGVRGRRPTRRRRSARTRPGWPAPPRSASSPSCAGSSAPTPAVRGLDADGRARARRRRPARADARCAASSRTPTTTATSTGTRSRCCRRASSSSATRRPRSATRRWPRPCTRCSPSRWPTS